MFLYLFPVKIQNIGFGISDFVFHDKLQLTTEHSIAFCILSKQNCETNISHDETTYGPIYRLQPGQVISFVPSNPKQKSQIELSVQKISPSCHDLVYSFNSTDEVMLSAGQCLALFGENEISKYRLDLKQDEIPSSNLSFINSNGLESLIPNDKQNISLSSGLLIPSSPIHIKITKLHKNHKYSHRNSLDISNLESHSNNTKYEQSKSSKLTLDESKLILEIASWAGIFFVIIIFVLFFTKGQKVAAETSDSDEYYYSYTEEDIRPQNGYYANQVQPDAPNPYQNGMTAYPAQDPHVLAQSQMTPIFSAPVSQNTQFSPEGMAPGTHSMKGAIPKGPPINPQQNYPQMTPFGTQDMRGAIPGHAQQGNTQPNNGPNLYNSGPLVYPPPQQNNPQNPTQPPGYVNPPGYPSYPGYPSLPYQYPTQKRRVRVKRKRSKNKNKNVSGAGCCC